MSGISGQPGTKPQAVTKPVPGAEAAMTADDLLASFDAPEMGAPAQAAAPQTADDLLNSMGAAEPVAPPEGMAQDEFAPEPGFVKANMQQFQDFTTRLQAGLAANDTEKVNLLKKKFGPDNVRMKDDKIYFRKNGEKAFRRLDPGTLELINDIIPDFAREFVTEAGMLPGEMAGAAVGAKYGTEVGALAGGAIGSVVPGPGTAAGALTGGLAGLTGGAATGALAGRVASVVPANAFADKVAEWAGVPQDETRSKTTENVIGGAAEALLPLAGKAVLKRLPGTEAYQAAKAAGKREIVALSEQSREVFGAMQRLVSDGRAAKVDGSLVGLPGSEVNLMGHHLNPDNPIIANFASQAASDPRFINAQTQLAEDWGASLTNTLTEIGRRGNKGPYNPEHLASSVTNAVADLQRAEGQAIGKYKAKAMANLKNEKQPLPPDVRQQAEALLREFGFTPKTKRSTAQTIVGGKTDGLPAGRRTSNLEQTVWVPPRDMSKLVKMGLTSEGEARAVVNSLTKFSDTMDTGMRVSDIENLRGELGSTADRLSRTRAGAEIGKLSGQTRQWYRNTITGALDDDFEKGAFNSAMDEFGQLKQSVEVLKSALNEDASAKAIVHSVFTGKENLQKVREIKRISPESFAALKEEFINQMLVDYGSRQNKTGFKSTQFLDAMNKKYGDEFLREVLDDGKGPGLKTVKDLLTVTERLDDTFRRAEVAKMSEQQKTGLMNATIGLIMKSPVKAVSGIGSILSGSKGTDNALTQIMTRDGIEKYIANYPGKIPDKAGLYKQLSDILATSRVYNAAVEAGSRATKAVVKEKAMDAAR